MNYLQVVQDFVRTSQALKVGQFSLGDNSGVFAAARDSGKDRQGQGEN
jgi:hypothetical protein